MALQGALCHQLRWLSVCDGHTFQIKLIKKPFKLRHNGVVVSSLSTHNLFKNNNKSIYKYIVEEGHESKGLTYVRTVV